MTDDFKGRVAARAQRFVWNSKQHRGARSGVVGGLFLCLVGSFPKLSGGFKRWLNFLSSTESGAKGD